ncbi:hypothetical protein Tco_1235583 [Tanacetum coccineum]
MSDPDPKPPNLDPQPKFANESIVLGIRKDVKWNEIEIKEVVYVKEQDENRNEEAKRAKVTKIVIPEVLNDGKKSANVVFDNVNSEVTGLVDRKNHCFKDGRPGLCLSKTEPKKIPLWVKIFNVSLKARINVKGISRIASRLGNHIIMDKITATMCENKYWMSKFAKVLIEVDAENALVESIEICYKSLGKSIFLELEYAWRPPSCSQTARTFGGCKWFMF